MSFPFSYTGEVVFYKPDDFNTDEFALKVKQKFNVEVVDEFFLFQSKSSFSKLPVKVKMSISDDNTSLHCQYKISLFENNIVFLAALVIAAFFYFNDNIAISVFAASAGLIYYLANTSRISHFLKAGLYNLMDSKIEYGTAKLWKKQKQWMKNPLLCPACGEQKNKYSNSCVNCGLVFSKSKAKPSQTNTSAAQNNAINYKLTKK